jgi:hypothetical protein
MKIPIEVRQEYTDLKNYTHELRYAGAQIHSFCKISLARYTKSKHMLMYTTT